MVSLRPCQIVSLAVLALALAACRTTPAPAPVLSSISQIRELSASEAERGYPVRLRAFVAYCDVPAQTLVVQDSTGGIIVAPTASITNLQTRDVIDIDGFTAHQAGTPLIVKPVIHLARSTPISAARRISVDEAASGRLDAQWVELAGRFSRPQVVDRLHWRTVLTAGNRSLDVVIHTPATLNTNLEGQSVRLRGVVLSVRDTSGTPLQTRLFVSDPGDIDAGPTPVFARTALPPFTPTSAPPLPTVAAIKQLTNEQALERRPAVLRGVINFHHSIYGGLFFQDSTGGLYLRTDETGGEIIPPGTFVEVRGLTEPGGYAPILGSCQIRRIAAGSHFPPVPVHTPSRLTAREENLWARAEGVIQNVSRNPRGIPTVRLSVAGQNLSLLFPTESSPGNLERLLDADVSAEGIISPSYDTQRRLQGFLLVVPSAAGLRLIRPSSADPFAAPLIPAGSVLQFRPEGPISHRIRVRGAVALASREGSLYLSSGDAGLEVRTSPGASHTVGDQLEVSGFVQSGHYPGRLDGTVIRTLPGRSEPTALAISAHEAQTGSLDARLVRIDGVLLNRRASLGDQLFLIQSGRSIFTAVLELPQVTGAVLDLRPGSIVRLSGICSADWDSSESPPLARSFRLLLRSPADIQVVRRASWWNLRNTLTVFGCTALAAVIAFAWVIVLRRRVRQQTDEIRAKLEHTAELEEQLIHAQKLESVGRLAGGVAHDFNNLLTVINGYSDMLLAEHPAHSRTWNALFEVGKAGKRAAALTQQLLAFSRKQILRPVSLNLNDVVKEMDSMLRRIAGPGIRVTASLDPHLGRVMADPGQMHQVLMNLAANARDAMPGGGELHIRTAHCHSGSTQCQTPGAACPGPCVVLSVSDTGHGMTPQVRSRVFEPFFTTKAFGQGTGLGLSTVFGIVKQSGGNVSVESEPGAGSTFFICLPRTFEEPPPPVHRALTSPLRGAETILVVENQTEVRDLVVELLRTCGYTVLCATSAPAALEVFSDRGEPVHLLLTDVAMPGMDGHELARRLVGLQPSLRIVFMSGHPEEAIHSGTSAAGFSFLQKPFTPASLLATVRAALD